MDVIGMWYFSVKHTALRIKSKDWLVRNQDNVSGTTGLAMDCCCSELALYNSN
jgi:cell fate regulator YaaT (PSP1 superfamily)